MRVIIEFLTERWIPNWILMLVIAAAIMFSAVSERGAENEIRYEKKQMEIARTVDAAKNEAYRLELDANYKTARLDNWRAAYEEGYRDAVKNKKKGATK